MRVNARVIEKQPHEKTEELVQLVAGVLLIAFAVVAVAALMTMQVSAVLGH